MKDTGSVQSCTRYHRQSNTRGRTRPNRHPEEGAVRDPSGHSRETNGNDQSLPDVHSTRDIRAPNSR